MRNPETGELQDAQYILDPESFNIHPEITNPLGLYTVEAYTLEKPARSKPIRTPAVQPNGDIEFFPSQNASPQKVTLIWMPVDPQKPDGKHEFRLAYEINPIVDLSTIGKEPRLLQENIEALPQIPIEDIQSGLAARSVLLAMERDGYVPFGPEAAEAYKKLGGYYLHFEMDKKLMWAELRSYVNLTRSSDYKPEENPLPPGVNSINLRSLSFTISPYIIKTEINGQVYNVPVLTLLNPKDPQNPDPNEFLVTFGIPSNGDQLPGLDYSGAFKINNPLTVGRVFLFGINPYIKSDDPNTIIFNPELITVTVPDPNNPKKMIQKQIPHQLSAKDPFQSLLAQLLGIEGNDIRTLPFYAYGNVYHYSDLIQEGLNGVEQSSLHIYERPIADDNPDGSDHYLPLDYGFENRVFLFEIGVAQ